MIVMQTLAILFIRFIFASSTGSGLAALGAPGDVVTRENASCLDT